jgi:hypothetical protein
MDKFKLTEKGIDAVVDILQQSGHLKDEAVIGKPPAVALMELKEACNQWLADYKKIESPTEQQQKDAILLVLMIATVDHQCRSVN